MSDAESKLEIGETHSFASIEDLIAVTNGEMSIEEADKRFRSKPRQTVKIVSVVTAINQQKGIVTFSKI